jgi:hypothetical protein
VVSLALILALLAGRSHAGALLLEGCTLVDPASRSEGVADLLMEDGRVVTATAQTPVVLDGRGRYALPALWDMKASLWGNDSAKDYHVLSQNLSVSGSLAVQLYYGVGHVVSVHMKREWLEREWHRAEKLEFPAAELIYPGQALAGVGGKAWAAEGISLTTRVGPALDARQADGASEVLAFYGDPKDRFIPGLPRPVLAALLKQARARRVPVYVFADTWDRVRDAASLGASAVQALPDGPPPTGLAVLMRRRGCAYAPSLCLHLEPGRLLGNRAILENPLFGATVTSDVLDSYLDAGALWDQWKPLVDGGARNRAAALKAVKRLADEGVTILSSSDSGWSLACFQGYATLATQRWLEAAKVDPWTRLRAATTAPAAFFGRKAGFEPGQAADFLVLDADPLAAADNLARLDAILWDGRVVDRDALKPDLVRHRFRPNR